MDSEFYELERTGIYRQQWKEFLDVEAAARRWAQAHQEVTGHSAWFDHRGGVDFTLACFTCVDALRLLAKEEQQELG